jgi:hypothetical protein
VVLSYPSPRIVISQTSVVASQRCFLTSGMIDPIVQSVSN